LIPRLAACCYWAILETGPDDTNGTKRVFGAPHDDPNFFRLESVGERARGEHRIKPMRPGKEYENEIRSAPPTIWPAAMAARARALIWLRMGKNAAELPSARRKKLAKLPETPPL